MDTLSLSLAYRYVAVAMMLSEINFCAGRLNLGVALPITRESLRTEHVSRPGVTGFGGTLETDRYSFVFFKSGVLRRVVRINAFEKMPLRDLQWKQAKMRSLINTNEAYRLATNWLTSIEVDVARLEQRYRPVVQQKWFYPDASGFDATAEQRKRVVLLPIFHVLWGDVHSPAVTVSIFGPTKELLAIHQENDSFSGRPHELIRDVDGLLRIPDGEFLKYSSDERRRLISRFAAVPYAQPSSAAEGDLPVKENPAVGSPREERNSTK